MILVFGIGFLVPLMLVLLNFAGVLSGRRLLGWWRWIIILVLAFSAVATPTGDPINLMLLAGPIFVLVMVAVGISLLNDRRRERRRRGTDIDYAAYDDDETSPLDETPSPIDENPSPLDDTPSPLDDGS
jgi:sec-independent protein translocase protein TatC